MRAYVPPQPSAPGLAVAAVIGHTVPPAQSGGGGGGNGRRAACFFIVQEVPAAASAVAGASSPPPLPPPRRYVQYFPRLTVAGGKDPAAAEGDPSGPSFVITAGDGAEGGGVGSGGSGGGGGCRFEAAGELLSFEAALAGGGAPRLRLETAPRAGAPARVPWRGPGSSPEGWAEGLADLVLRLHWHVFTLASPAAVALVAQPPLPPLPPSPQLGQKGAADSAAQAAQKGAAAQTGSLKEAVFASAAAAPPPAALQPPPLRGWLHAEKNWGAAFPPAYVWAQGVAADGAAAFALSAGPLPAPLGVPVALLSVHLPGGRVVAFDAERPGAVARLEADGCRGALALAVAGLGAEVTVDILAARGSFAPVPCPTVGGFEVLEKQPLRAAQGRGAWPLSLHALQTAPLCSTSHHHPLHALLALPHTAALATPPPVKKTTGLLLPVARGGGAHRCVRQARALPPRGGAPRRPHRRRRVWRRVQMRRRQRQRRRRHRRRQGAARGAFQVWRRRQARRRGAAAPARPVNSHGSWLRFESSLEWSLE